jgi:hypothetical protein
MRSAAAASFCPQGDELRGTAAQLEARRTADRQITKGALNLGAR